MLMPSNLSTKHAYLHKWNRSVVLASTLLSPEAGTPKSWKGEKGTAGRAGRKETSRKDGEGEWRNRDRRIRDGKTCTYIYFL